MPTFTTVALENLLHHGVHDSQKKSREETEARNGGPRHLYIMPALYSTPQQSPLPANATPHSPSPYVVNHKRRGAEYEGRVIPELPQDDGLRLEEGERSSEEVGVDFFEEDFGGEEDENLFAHGALEYPCEAASQMNEEATGLSTKEIETPSYASAPGEFFDAIDDFASDGSTYSGTSCDNRLESELHVSRLSLLEEIERRKAAEESLALMRSQWERIRNLLAEAGLTFPAFAACGDNIQPQDNLLEQISQEIQVARFVSEAIGRGQAQAEAEEAAATIIESKDQEILRLRDRLQYYEIVNHELSQRNLVEVARRQQERKRSRRRWLQGFMGISIAVGVSVAAYVYIPQVSERLSGDSAAAANTSADV